jgi:predicted ATPase
LKERLRQRRKGQKYGRPFSFLILNNGKGVAWKGEQGGRQIDDASGNFDLLGLMESLKSGVAKEESSETEVVELEDRRKLGIATLGALKQHPRISAFRRFIEGWYLSYFTPNAARSLPLAGPQKHLNSRGDNLGNVVQFMEREHPKRFQNILNRIADKIPGIDKIDTEKTNDGRLLLRFNDYCCLKIPPHHLSYVSKNQRTVFIINCLRLWPKNSVNTLQGEGGALRFL